MILLQQNRVRSFSLIEILVVMVLTSMVVGILYFSFFVVSGYQLNLERRVTQFEEISALHSLLRSDFDKAVMVKKTSEDQLLLHTKNEWIHYTFNNNYIVRVQAERRDTLIVKIKSYRFLRNSIEVTTGNSFIDKVEVAIDGTSLPMLLSIVKVYDAASRIEMDTLKSTYEGI